MGSSNLSESALQHGVEWNYRVLSSEEESGFDQVVHAFEKLFWHEKTQFLTDDWLKDYELRHRQPQQVGSFGLEPETDYPIPEPHMIQAEALKALDASRRNGFKAGLVVLATGLGKTWLSAFDTFYGSFKKVLFVAHREEILNQSMETFRRIHTKKTFGRYDGLQNSPMWIFYSLQSRLLGVLNTLIGLRGMFLITLWSMNFIMRRLEPTGG